MEGINVKKEVDDHDVFVKVEVEMLDDKEYLELKLAEAEKRVSELEKEKVWRDEELGEVVRVGRDWRRVAEEWRGEAERSEAAARYWRGTVKDKEKGKKREDMGIPTEEMYNGLNKTFPVHAESEATADEQMVPEYEVLVKNQSSLSIPRRYSRRNRKHYGDDGDQGENCDVIDPKKTTKNKNPDVDGEKKIRKPASHSFKPSAGSKRKVIASFETVHRKERPFGCSEAGCKERFGLKSNMKSHVRSVHRGKQPFPCTEVGCKVSFGRKSNMKSHVRIVHRGEQPFPCTEVGCKKNFGLKATMEQHVRLFHRRERPFVCPNVGCKERFGRKYLVADHLRAAHGDPKLVCGVGGCSSDFLSFSAISKHKKKFHKGRG